MPYKRSYKPRYRKRRTYRKPKSSWMGYARKGLSLARQVWKLKGLVNSEKYKFDTAFNAQSVTSSGTVYHVTAIAQGDGDAQRTGNSIFVRSVDLKGSVTYGVGGNFTQEVKVALVMDTQQISDTSPSITDIYESNTVNSHLNSDTVGRFKILHSQVFVLDGAQELACRLDINKTMRHHIRFNGTSSSDIQKGGLYLVTLSNQSAANFPVFNGELRVSYHDN